MHVEHIDPIVEGGASTENNLWLSCPLCNGHKGTQTHSVDPVTRRRMRLFNPRRQVWRDHFRWSDDGIEVMGVTPVGRATVIALKLNNDHLVRARRRWVAVGWHPPQA
jgi:hypothetical protein